jgi:hypothetical protein
MAGEGQEDVTADEQAAPGAVSTETEAPPANLMTGYVRVPQVSLASAKTRRKPPAHISHMHRNGTIVNEPTLTSLLTIICNSMYNQRIFEFELREPDVGTIPRSPSSPHIMDWSPHYPDYCSTPSIPVDGNPTEASSSTAGQKKVEFADVGCGFGGLLIALAPQFPDTLMLGKPRTMSVSAVPSGC